MVPAVSVVTPGKLVLAMGTSTCHLILSDKEVTGEGICGVVEDGIIPVITGMRQDNRPLAIYLPGMWMRQCRNM